MLVTCKQKRGPWGMGLRDTYNLSRSTDKMFGGVEQNHSRKIADAWEGMGADAVRNKNKDLPLLQEGLELGRQHAGPVYDEFNRLRQVMTMAQRDLDAPLNRQGFNTGGAAKVWRDEQYNKNKAAWDALPAELKTYSQKLDKFAMDRLDEQGEVAAHNVLLKDLGFEDPALLRRVIDGTHTEADFQRLGTDEFARQKNLELIQDIGKPDGLAIYTPQIREGDYVTHGLFKTPGMEKGKKLTDSSFEFDTYAEAVAAAKQQHGEATINKHYVDANGDRFSILKDQPVLDAKGDPALDTNGKPRLGDKEIPYTANDPGVTPKWRVDVERGYMSKHKTYRDAKAEKAELDKLGTHDRIDVQPERYNPNQHAVTLASGITDLEARAKALPGWDNLSKTQQQTVKAALADHYLNHISATKVRSSQLRRNFIPGASDDTLGAFHQFSEDSASSLARMKHAPTVDKAFEDWQQAIHDNPNTTGMQALWNEFKKREEGMATGFYNIASGRMSPAMQRVMTISAMARLATPGFSIRNLTQSAMFIGEVGGKHGYATAVRELAKMYKDIAAHKILATGVKETGKAIKGDATNPASLVADARARFAHDPRMQEVIDYLVDRNRLNPDAGFQIEAFLPRNQDTKVDFRFGRTHGAESDNALTRGIEAGLGKIDKGIHYLDQISRQMPRASETVNRLTTMGMAYRLEKKSLMKNGLSEADAHQKAMVYADDMVAKTHFVYTDINKPGWERNNWLRPAFQFKKFGKSAYEMLGRHISNSISRDVPAEDRAAARRALGGLFVTHTMVAGALGLPWEPVRALLIGAKSAGITDKDWDDVENGIRRGITAVGNLAGLDPKTNKMASEALAKGLPRLLNMDMSPGLGMDNMALFNSPRNGPDRDYDTNLTSWLFNNMTGAPAALVLQYLHGLRDLSSGEWAKGAAALSPMKIGADLIKATTGYAEGKHSTRGRETMAPYSAGEAIQKAMGIPVGREAEQGTYAHQVYQQGQEKSQERSKLLAAYVAAKTPEARQAASAAAREGGIKGDELARALTREQSAGRRVVNGVVTNNRDRENARKLGDVYNLRRD